MSYATGFALYDRLPAPGKRAVDALLAPIPRSLLLGAGFRSELRALQRSERATRAELEAMQDARLAQVLRRANATVPYYRRLFREHDIDVHGPDPRALLERIPILTKETARGAGESLWSADRERLGVGEAKTSGSTGQPFHFLLSQRAREAEYAALWRAISSYGVDVDCKIASIRGELASDAGGTRAWRYDGLRKEMQVNSYAIGPERVAELASALDRFRPDLIRGYPHSLFLLAKISRTHGVSVQHAPKLLLTSSETLTLEMREEIGRFFGAPILDWYGQSEYVISMGQCRSGIYHQSMETGVMRLVDDGRGSPRIVGTTLTNDAMPLINYDIGDRVAPNATECSCGRAHAGVRSVGGRANDMLVALDGRVLGGTTFDHYWKHEVTPHLKRVPVYIHFRQAKDKAITLQYAGERWDEGDEATASEGLHRALGATPVAFDHLAAPPISTKWRLIESEAEV